MSSTHKIKMKFGLLFLCFFPLFSWGKETPPISSAEKSVQPILKEFDQTINDLWKNAHVAGMSIIIVDQNKILYQKNLGVRKIGSQDKIDAHTVFQLASVSKPLSSTVIAAVMSQPNKINLNWDTRIQSLDPEFTLGDAWVTQHLTIKDLLSHRSGLPDHAGDDLEDLGFSKSEILSRLKFLALKNFRNDYAYTNFGFSEAAYSVAKWKKINFDQLAKIYLLNPLNMHHTYTRYQDFLNEPNHAVLHTIKNNQTLALYERNPDEQSPAGGFSSNSLDLAAWMQCLLNYGYSQNKKVIDSNIMDSLQIPVMNLGFGPYNFYGLGFGIEIPQHRDLILKHSGAFFLGARTAIYIIPEKKIAIAILTNSFPTGLPEAIGDIFLDLLYDKKTTNDWVNIWNARYQSLVVENKIALPQKLNPVDAAIYSGNFKNNYFGELHILLEKNQVFLEIHNQRFALLYIKPNTFVMETRGENQSGLRYVTFNTDATGKILSVTVDAWNENHLGTFLKI